jgi:transcriptional regulator with XRE-family HTH domain
MPNPVLSLYERILTQGGGDMALAKARLRYEARAILHQALAQAGITRTELARRLGVHKSGVTNILNGDDSLRTDTIATYLCAMGFELKIAMVPLGATRKQFEDETRQALSMLDGTTKSRVALLSGLSAEEINRLGGIEEEA